MIWKDTLGRWKGHVWQWWCGYWRLMGVVIAAAIILLVYGARPDTLRAVASWPVAVALAAVVLRKPLTDFLTALAAKAKGKLAVGSFSAEWQDQIFDGIEPSGEGPPFPAGMPPTDYHRRALLTGFVLGVHAGTREDRWCLYRLLRFLKKPRRRRPRAADARSLLDNLLEKQIVVEKPEGFYEIAQHVQSLTNSIYSVFRNEFEPADSAGDDNAE